MNTKKNKLVLAGVITFTLFHGACLQSSEKGNLITDLFTKSVFDIEGLSEKLDFDSNFSIYPLVQNDSTFSEEEIRKIYTSQQPFWFQEDGPVPNLESFVEALQQADIEGLNPENYFLSTLKKKLENIQNGSVVELRDAEVLLTYSYLKFAKHLLLGQLAPLKIDKNWQSQNDTTWSVDSAMAHLQRESMEAILEKYRPAHPWYAAFKNAAAGLKQLKNNPLQMEDLPQDLQLGDTAANIQRLRNVLLSVTSNVDKPQSNQWDTAAIQSLKKFQQQFALPVTGQLDSITRLVLLQDADQAMERLWLNMERMRWMQKDFSKEFIWVNIPQMEVHYLENNELTFYMRAVVGKVSRKTPTLDSKLSNIVFNPPWFVPPTILKQEIIPGIARRGGYYLRKRGLIARDRRGRIVNPAYINSSNFRRYSISQNPGRNSALGSVKFSFPNKESIYLHDTNHREGFSRTYRATSSGCIRVHHPKDFARFIMRDSTYSAANIDSIIEKRKTTFVKAPREIGVHIVYLTNALDSAGHLITVNDIYDWDSKLQASLTNLLPKNQMAANVLHSE